MKLIIAIDKKGVMGNKGKLPWKLPDDLKHFKEETYGSTIIMGSKTYFSLPLLPHRKHLVLSRSLPETRGQSSICGNSKADVIFYNSIESLLGDLTDKENCYLIGGADVIKQLLPHVTSAIITHVDADIKEYDTIMDLDLSDFKISSSDPVTDPKNSHSFRITRYVRRS